MTTVPPATPATPAGAPAAKTPILSILSLVGGGLGILCCGFTGIFSIAGIVLGFLGRSKEPNGKGLAMAGIITGFVGLALGLVWIIVWLVLGASALPFYSYYNSYGY